MHKLALLKQCKKVQKQLEIKKSAGKGFRQNIEMALTAFTTAFCTLNRAEFKLVEEVCCSEDPH